MNESKKQFVDQLIGADPPSAGARERYEKEIRSMLEKSLTPRQRGAYLATAMVLMLIGLFFTVNVIVVCWEPLPEGEFIKYVVAYFQLTSLVLLGLVVLLVRAFWSGVLVRRTASRWIAILGVAYVGLLGWIFMVSARHVPEILRDDVRVLGLVLFVYAAIAWVRSGTALAESRTTEKLLEIELRLAQMEEARGSGPRTTEPVSS
jgi:hypothetical protein